MTIGKTAGDMVEHVETEKRVTVPTNAPLADYDIIDRGGEAVLLSIEGHAEAAATHLKLAKDGHVRTSYPNS